MKKLIIAFLLLVNLAEARVAIVTGGTGGTYYPFGQQISSVCGDIVGGLDTISTKGSLDNVQRLLNKPNVKFAIVQYDVLLNIINSDKYSAKIKRAVNNLRVVMPLYDEEIHIIVKKDLDIKSFDDFKNLRVSVEKKGSGTFVTATNIAKYTGVRWAKTYTKNIKDSLKAISNNELDAVFYVSGAPSKIFKISEDMNIFDIYKSNFKLLDIGNNKELDKIYSSSKILKKDYNWMDKSIDTKSVRAVLITYNYKPHQPSYKKVKKLYQCIYDNLEQLQTNKFHPKWNEVDPTDFRGINWKTHNAVIDVIEQLGKNSNSKEEKKYDFDKNKDSDELNNFFDNL